MVKRSRAAGKAAPRSMKSQDVNAALLKRASGASDIRFEATLGSTPYRKALAMAAGMDLDRLPDVAGRVRLLITPDDARRLLEMGVPVHLDKAHPLRPLSREQVMTDEHAQSWLDKQLKGLPKQGGR